MKGWEGVKQDRRMSLLYSMAFPFMGTFISVLITLRDPVLALILATITALVAGPSFTLVSRFIIPRLKRLPAWLSYLGMLVTIGALFIGGFWLTMHIFVVLFGRLTPFSAEAIKNTNMGWERPEVQFGLKFGVILMVLAFAYLQVASKMGPRVFWGWVMGRYLHPKPEERIFMFLDMRDSTTLAEQLGDRDFSALVQAFFRDLTPALSESKGEVSHYIGDEAVITWPISRGIKDANCLRLFFLFGEMIESRSDWYRQKFGVVPSFKAGVHMGPVVAAEVGEQKSEIVYHGDTVNTTARIQGLCDMLGHSLLLSGQVAKALPSDAGLELKPTGWHQLKGREEPVEVFSAQLTSSEA